MRRERGVKGQGGGVSEARAAELRNVPEWGPK